MSTWLCSAAVLRWLGNAVVSVRSDASAGWFGAVCFQVRLGGLEYQPNVQ